MFLRILRLCAASDSKVIFYVTCLVEENELHALDLLSMCLCNQGFDFES